MTETPKRKRSALLLFTGGLLPVIAFTLVEEYYGPMAGVIAGIVFGAGEMLYEYVTQKKIQGITIASNALVLVLGGFSLWESNGVLFKLQPAFLLMGFALFMLGSSLIKKPFLAEVMKKQYENPPPGSLDFMAGLNIRVGLAVFVLGWIGVYAAYYWSTPLWAAYKAFGAPLLLVIYMVSDMFLVAWWRRRRR